MHREAAKGLRRTWFMGATSMRGANRSDPHYDLCQTLQIASLNIHDRAAIDAISRAGGHFSFYNGGNRWTYGRYMKMLRVRHRLALRLTWHFNIVAGDPYYALDCREDDYCWFNTNADGQLIPSLSRFTILAGLNDYRYLSTLERLLAENPEHANHRAARKVWDRMMNLRPGIDRDRDVDFAADRAEVIEAIMMLR